MCVIRLAGFIRPFLRVLPFFWWGGGWRWGSLSLWLSLPGGCRGLFYLLLSSVLVWVRTENGVLENMCVFLPKQRGREFVRQRPRRHWRRRRLEIWEPGNLGICRAGDLEIQKFGDLGTWKSRNLEIWRPGNPEIWGQTNKKQ